MIIFVYDKTFEGLLTAVFDAYSRRTFPDLLVTEGEPFPLFYDEAIRIYTDDRKAERVWKGLEKKISKSSLSGLTVTWLSELPEVDLLLFRYIRKAIDAPATIEFITLPANRRVMGKNIKDNHVSGRRVETLQSHNVMAG